MKATLNEAIEDFERFRRSQGIRKGTIGSHRSVLKRFLTVNGNIYTDKISGLHVTRYFEEAAKTRQPQTLQVDHVALNLFFDWCRHTKRMGIDNDPMYGRRRPRGTVKERERLHVSQFANLLTAAEARCHRDRAAVAVLLYTLLRDQDVADLRVRDVDLNAGYLTARIQKTGLEDRLPICEELDTELRTWLTYYAQEAGPLQPNWRLVPARKVGIVTGKDGRFLQGGESTLNPDRSVGRMGRVVVPILESIGFPVVDMHGKRMSEGAHTIRRSGARALFDRLVADGYDGALRVVQAMLHHKSVTQTEHYIGIRADRRTRDEIIRGQVMYLPDGGNVTPLLRERGA